VGGVPEGAELVDGPVAGLKTGRAAKIVSKDEKTK
jgi:hypothetical protein